MEKPAEEKLGPDVLSEKIPLFYEEYKKLADDYKNSRLQLGNLHNTMKNLLKEGKKHCALSKDEYTKVMVIADLLQDIHSGRIINYKGDAEIYKKDNEKDFEQYSQTEAFNPGKALWIGSGITTIGNGFLEAYNNYDEDDEIPEELNNPYNEKDAFYILDRNIANGKALDERGFADSDAFVPDKISYFYRNIGQLIDYAVKGEDIEFNSKLNEMIHSYDFTNFTEEVKNYLDNTGSRFLYGETEYKLIFRAANYFEKLIASENKDAALSYFDEGAEEIENIVDTAYQEFYQKNYQLNAQVQFFVDLYYKHTETVAEMRKQLGSNAGSFYKLNGDDIELSDRRMVYEFVHTSVRNGFAEAMMDDYLECLDKNGQLAKELLENIPSVGGYGITDPILLDKYKQIEEKLAGFEKAAEVPFDDKQVQPEEIIEENKNLEGQPEEIIEENKNLEGQPKEIIEENNTLEGNQEEIQHQDEELGRSVPINEIPRESEPNAAENTDENENLEEEINGPELEKNNTLEVQPEKIIEENNALKEN